MKYLAIIAAIVLFVLFFRFLVAVLVVTVFLSVIFPSVRALVFLILAAIFINKTSKH